MDLEVELREEIWEKLKSLQVNIGKRTFQKDETQVQRPMWQEQ